jgi:hypothetical protein
MDLRFGLPRMKSTKKRYATSFYERIKFFRNFRLFNALGAQVILFQLQIIVPKAVVESYTIFQQKKMW